MPSDQFYEQLIDELSEGVVFLDESRTIRFWSRGATKLTGFSREEVESESCAHNCMRFGGNDSHHQCKKNCSIHRALAGETLEEEIMFQHRDGHRIPVLLRLIPKRAGVNGPIEGVVEILTDITERRRIQEEMAELQRTALLDPLTDTGNRRFGELRLNAQLEEAKRYGSAFGVLFIDIDKFKVVNDSFGHDAGDRVLRMVGKTLHHHLRPFDLVSRWGGEEFIAIILNVNEEQLMVIAEKIRELISISPLRHGAQSIRVTVSIGATLSMELDHATALINRADRAMYQAKEQGRNRVVLI